MQHSEIRIFGAIVLGLHSRCIQSLCRYSTNAATLLKTVLHFEENHMSIQSSNVIRSIDHILISWDTLLYSQKCI
jgi:hypothetical protein